MELLQFPVAWRYLMPWQNELRESVIKNGRRYFMIIAQMILFRDPIALWP